MNVLKVYSTISGDNRGKDPPVHIPNTEVKLSIAESSALATMCEGRTLPDSNKNCYNSSVFLLNKKYVWSTIYIKNKVKA